MLFGEVADKRLSSTPGHRIESKLRRRLAFTRHGRKLKKIADKNDLQTTEWLFGTLYLATHALNRRERAAVKHGDLVNDENACSINALRRILIGSNSIYVPRGKFFFDADPAPRMNRATADMRCGNARRSRNGNLNFRTLQKRDVRVRDKRLSASWLASEKNIRSGF